MVIQKITPLTNKPKFLSQVTELNNNLFAISNDYMNNSGFAVVKLASFYKISPENIYIIHDDLDLPIGEYRFQFDRGPAGHNGIKSTIEQLGTQAFNRIRIGIDHPRNSTTSQIAVEDYVLLPFTTAEKAIIDQTIYKIIEEINNLSS